MMSKNSLHHSLVILIAVIIALVSPQIAVAQAAFSDGCADVNHPARDSLYASTTLGTKNFFAGERITVSAGAPTTVGTPTLIELEINNSAVDSSSFPGTTTHLFTTNSTVKLGWRIDGGNVTWSASCGLAQSQPIPAISTYGLGVLMLGMLLLAGRRARRSSIAG